MTFVSPRISRDILYGVRITIYEIDKKDFRVYDIAGHRSGDDDTGLSPRRPALGHTFESRVISCIYRT